MVEIVGASARRVQSGRAGVVESAPEGPGGPQRPPARTPEWVDRDPRRWVRWAGRSPPSGAVSTAGLHQPASVWSV